MKVTSQSRAIAAPDVLYKELEGEAVLLNLNSGVYFGLDPVGTRVWELLNEHKSLGTVHRLLLAEYAVSSSQLWSDLEAIVSRMQARGLLRIEEPEAGRSR